MALSNQALVRARAGSPSTDEISDELIDTLLAANSDNTSLTTADVLEARAAYWILQSVSKSIGGTFNYDARRVATNFRELAKQVRDLVFDGVGEFDIAEIAQSPVFGEELIRLNEIMRSQP
jgi:hypothetical protein